MAIELNGTTGITTPDINTTAQSTDITTTGDISAVDVTASGGVYLGGTAAANYLDDYEEGTFTPTTAGDASGAFTSTPTGEYTKIGNVCTVRIVFVVGTTFTSNTIGGLPFTVGGSNVLSGLAAIVPVMTASSNESPVIASAGVNGTDINFWVGTTTGNTHEPNTTNAVYRIGLTYRTT